MRHMISSRQFKPVTTCHVCGGTRFSRWAKTTYRQYLKLRTDIPADHDPLATNIGLINLSILLLQCLNCKFVFTSPRVPNSQLEKIYDQETKYFTTYANTKSLAHQHRKQTFMIEIQRISKLARGNKLLDVGCGGGYFLDELGPSWKRIGVEIDPLAAKAAKKLLGSKVSIIHASLENSRLPKNSLDVVVIRGTIEHVPSPRQTLQTIHSLLKPSGLIAINTPNINSIAAKLYRSNYRLADPIHHIWYFSPSTINRLLKEVGFTLVAVDFNYFNTPYFQFKDLAAVSQEWLKYQITGKRPRSVSPPFFGNIMDVYARKV